MAKRKKPEQAADAPRDNWRMSLRNARELRKQGCRLLYDRLQLLIRVSEDTEYEAHCFANNIAAIDQMDDELSDVACSFLTLRVVLDKYPRKDDWANGNLRKMIAECMVSSRGEQKRQVPNWKERALAAEKECERLRVEVATLSARVSDLQDTIALMSTGRKQVAAA